jgi:hypothetical protein
VAVPSTIELGGDVLAAATTLAGLVLVFLAATVGRYESYDAVMRDKKFRDRFKRRAWFIFVGFALAVLSALLSLFGKWFHCEPLVLAAIVAFVIASLWVVSSAVAMVREIQ